MESAFELVAPVEYLKNNVQFSQNTKANFEKILNLQQIENGWFDFRDHQLSDIQFFINLNNQSEKSAKNFINTANKEFSDDLIFKENLDKNLFYHILLKANVGVALEDFTINQFSQIFPSLKLVTKVKKTIVSEDTNTIVIRLVGELEKGNLKKENIEKKYDEIYKPLLKFKVTEFTYIYRTTYTLDKKTGLLINGKTAISEKIKNNFECITRFEINQVEL